MTKRGTLGLRTSGGVALIACGLFGACGTDDDRPPPGGASGNGTSGAGNSGRGGRGGSSNGQGGSGEAGTGDAGTSNGGAPTSTDCGDGVRSVLEECEGSDLHDMTCVDLGFDEGELACSDDCLFDVSACIGVERCADSLDNDGDGDSDCDDADCDEACADPCSSPDALPDPAEVTAFTTGRADATSSACSVVASDPGPDAVFTFSAAHTGTLEVELDATQYMVVSLHPSCGPTSTELDCSTDFLSLPVTEGDEVFIVVESPTLDDVGAFTLRAFSRQNDVCGDGYRDAGEGCDDGGQIPNDGCSTSCEVELVESEGNDSYDVADDYFDGFYAEIAPAGDQDVVAVDIGGSPGSLVVEVRGFGEDCDRQRTDSFVEVLDPDGSTVLDSDDDGGEALCSRMVVSGLAAGTHFVRVSAAAAGATPTFPYILDVTRNWCGDGILGPAEECDEGDTTPGDGCSATCQNE